MFDDLKSMYDSVKNWFKSEPESDEMSQLTLLERKMGERVPLSLATAMIFEADSARPDKWDKLLLINLRTLIRNIYNAVPTERKVDLKADDVFDVLLQEVNILQQLVPEYAPSTDVEFYLPDYSTLYDSFTKSNPRKFTTEKQRQEVALTYKVEQRLKEKVEDKDDPLPFEFRQSSWKLDKDERPTLLLTSFPTDLLSQYQFPKLGLLESHTGRIKYRSAWYTKLNRVNGEDLSRIPFNKFTITVFGDNTFFLVSHRKIKALVLQMAERDRWNYMTTEGKIKNSIGKMKHIADRQAMMDLF